MGLQALKLGWKSEDDDRTGGVTPLAPMQEPETAEPTGIRTAAAGKAARAEISRHVAARTVPERVIEAWERGHGHPWFGAIKGVEYEVIDLIAPTAEALLERVAERRGEGWDCWIKGKFEGTPIDSAYLFRPLVPPGVVRPEDGRYPGWSDSYDLLLDISEGRKDPLSIWEGY